MGVTRYIVLLLPWETMNGSHCHYAFLDTIAYWSSNLKPKQIPPGSTCYTKENSIMLTTASGVKSDTEVTFPIVRQQNVRLSVTITALCQPLPWPQGLLDSHFFSLRCCPFFISFHSSHFGRGCEQQQCRTLLQGAACSSWPLRTKVITQKLY